MAEEEMEVDRVAELRSQQQQSRIAEESAAEEAERLQAEGASEAGSSSSVFGISRDDLNDSVSRFLAKPEPVELILGFIPYINLQLIWGHLITNGKSKFITPPNFRPWRLQWILPNILATVIVIVFDLLLLILALPSLIVTAAFLYLIGKALSGDALGAVSDAKMLFGAFGCTLVQWLGFPSVLC